MRFFRIQTIWIICVLAFTSSLIINQLNLQELPVEKKRNGITVKTNDDASYLSPAINFINTGEWKDNSLGKQSYFVRPPGYGVIYYACAQLSNPTSALTLLKMIQTLLFSISVFWLFYIAKIVLKSTRTAYALALLYGLFPIANGFLFYTLTEGITPAILLYYVYLLFKAHGQGVLTIKRNYYFTAAVVFAVLLIIRPQLGLFGILISVFLIRDYLKYGVKKTLLNILFYSITTFSLTIVWQVRNYNIANKYVGLHSIYFEDSNSIYRPTFKAYWEFSTAWAQEGKITHSYMVPMYLAALEGDTSSEHIDKALNTYPPKVVEHFGYERLSNMLKKYQKATLHQKGYFDKGVPMPMTTPAMENEFIKDIELLVSEYKSKFWVDYYLTSPLRVFKVMSFHSNLSLHIFQHTYRGNLIIESIRYLSYSIHSLSFIVLILSVFLLKQMDWRIATINLIGVMYIFYLCFFQRGIEERYTLPLLSFMLLSLFYVGGKFFSLLRR